MKKRTKRVLSIVLSVVGIGMIVFGGITWYLSFKYEALIKRKLPFWTTAATDSLYHVTFDKLFVNIFTQEVSVTNVRIIADQKKVVEQSKKRLFNILEGDIQEISVAGVDWDNLKNTKDLTCSRFLMSCPHLTITSIINSKDSSKQSPEKINRYSTSVNIERLIAGQIRIINPSVYYRHISGVDTFSLHFLMGDIQLNDWEYKTHGLNAPNCFFHARKAIISVDSFEYLQPKSKYKLNAGSFLFSSFDSTIALNNFNVSPNAMFIPSKTQSEVYSISFPALNVSGFDWVKYFNQKTIAARRIDMGNPTLNVYLDRWKPADTLSRLGKYPQQILMKQAVPVDLREVYMKNANVYYTEKSVLSNKESTISFENIDGKITNISNLPENSKSVCVGIFSGQFMHLSNISTTFTWWLNDTIGTFRINGHLLNVDASQINQQAKSLALADFSSLTLDSAGYDIYGDQYETHGTFSILYHNLKVRLKKVDTTTHRIKGRPFLSFLANNILLYPSNPMPGESVRTVTTHTPRDIERSFFNQVWKALFYATGKTAVRDGSLSNFLKMMKDRKAKKPRPTKISVHFYRRKR